MKKIDFIRYDEDDEKLYIVQGTLSAKPRESAKSFKASDLNTTTTWLNIRGQLNKTNYSVCVINNSGKFSS